MTEIRQETAHHSSGASDVRRLDDLLALEPPRLRALYEAAATPEVAEVHGDLRGRMLATTVLTGWPATLARTWASSDRFVWRGKSFMPRTDERGEGINRVLVDRFRLYRFETFVGPSRAGDFDALQLDYDLPENPFFIRVIKDELRRLHEGLWLGQAYLHRPSGDTLVLYFGLGR